MKKDTWLRILTCVLLFFTFSGCGGSEGDYFRYDMPAAPQNLDPQTTGEEDASFFLRHMMEGLMRADANGEIKPAAAESYEISTDGLTYTFRLREGMVWVNRSGEEVAPVTADDFVFAFERLFSMKSTAAQKYTMIRNAQKILSQGYAPQLIGVKATDEHTITIRLDYPSEEFLALLAEDTALPCNREFFDSTGGKYGLGNDHLLYNGGFYIRRWIEDTRINLVKNPLYYNTDRIKPQQISVMLGEDPAAYKELFAQERISVLSLTAEETADYTAEQVSGFSDTAWVMAFHAEDPFLANAALRASLVQAIDRSQLSGLPQGMTPAKAIIPPVIEEMGVNYRKVADAVNTASPLEFDVDAAREGYRTTAEELGLSNSVHIKILAPEDAQIYPQLQKLQQMWQQTLPIFVDLELAEESEVLSRCASGNFQIAILPVQAQSDSAGLMMLDLADKVRRLGYSNEEFFAITADLSALASRADRILAIRRAEEMLMSDAVLTPLFYGESFYAVQANVEGLVLTPFGWKVDFSEATIVS